MTPFHEQLIQIDVIDEEGINKIRERINVRYHTLNSKQKATIFARTIHDMIDRSLPNFSKETKRSIRMELMNKKLSTNYLSISANDIIESSIALASEAELKIELSQWMQEKVEIDSNMAESYVDNLRKSRKKEESEQTLPSESAVRSTIQVDDHVLSTTQNIIKSKLKKHKPYFLGATAIILILFGIIVSIEYPAQKNMDLAKGEADDLKGTATQERLQNELPPSLQYEEIDDRKLRDWLHGRNSLLADEPYFSTIIEVANEYNIHPLLLFAITGQEQGFVSRDHKDAEKIANNPFNVYYSWKDFNTNITESSQIAARTIVNLSKDRPADVDPIQWINRKYAEDENWWLGVSAIFKQLEGVTQ
ncbi:hypothetical protein [Cytobacillus dafuensis]|uniref:Uncharacterized protein n=1 Tax=Cytobacillus dafuensis TaxID=1742359 RepID=A0A5B8Z1K3_CYTDA|nr:hypothetical protein [Cytobacillus dafuensis]QED46892.1 hypothetical protein FSZ17_06200 [Cytobacillus dafuensis]